MSIIEKATIQNPENGKIAVVANKLNNRLIPLRIILAINRDISRVADHVRVGQNPVTVDREAGTDAPTGCTRIPGSLVVRLLGSRKDADQAPPNINRRLSERISCDQQ
jgi:hypothetical protein